MDATAQARAAALLHRASHAPGEAMAPPIASSATYFTPDVEGLSHVYGRSGMPTWEVLEDRLGFLEGGTAIAYPSGMAAISAALVACLAAGKKLILPADGYYVSRLLSANVLARYGVEVVEVPTLAMAAADYSGAAAVLVETPSNPGLDVCDIAAIAEKAHAAGAKVIVDNTTMTPLLQRPLDLGADIVVAADTKAPGGHADVLFGHAAVRDAGLAAQLKEERRLSGAVPGAFEAWLVLRGLETLEVRLSRMCASAMVIAQRLAGHRSVKNTRYPGLAGDASHGIAKRQMGGFGFLIGFELADAARAERFLSDCTLIAQTTSFGGTHSSGERRIRWGDAVAPGFIRLSVGVEPVEVLWAAMAAALD